MQISTDCALTNTNKYEVNDYNKNCLSLTKFPKKNSASFKRRRGWQLVALENAMLNDLGQRGLAIEMASGLSRQQLEVVN